MKMLKFFLILSALIQFCSCSGAPPVKEEEVELKNQAASFAEAGNKYYNEGRYDQALNVFNLALAYNGAVYNEKGLVQSYLSIGKVYLAMAKDDEALALFEKALELSRTIDDKELIAQSLNNIGEYQIGKNAYDKALGFFQDAHNVSVSESKLAVINHNIGIVYRRQKKYDLAISSFQYALSFNQANRKFAEAASNNYMLSSVYSEKGEYKTAFQYALKALENDKKMENSLGIEKDYSALGIISLRLEKESDAYLYFKNSLLVCRSIKTIRPTVPLQHEIETLINYIMPLAQKLEGAAASENYKKILDEK
jgi:tetratricopeptide (TPR) repeat protein